MKKLNETELLIYELMSSFKFTVSEKLGLLASYKEVINPAVWDQCFEIAIFTRDFKNFMENRRKN